jgi:CubicO group peptidase (beta-lactamase class C family)
MGYGDTIEGTCAPEFARVRETLAKNLDDDLETGVSVAVVLDGEPVVDLWGGHADAARSQPWKRDTIVNLYSTTKGPTAVCAHVLADRGELDLDAPVATYWPEFAAKGKETLPVRWLLSHQAGLSGLEEPRTNPDFYDWDLITSALAAQEPWWEPGTKSGYHAMTYGFLVGEVVRRISGRSLGTFFRDEVAGPLGLDLHIGLADEHHARVSDLIPPPPGRDSAGAVGNLNDIARRTMSNPPPERSGRFPANTAEWRRAEIPAANGHGNARSIARLYAPLARGGELDGVRILSAQAIERAATPQVAGRDLVLGVGTTWGLGFVINGPSTLYGPEPTTFGHSGYGGSFGFADRTRRLSMGYAMNRMGANLVGDPRTLSLIAAVYGSL